MTYPNRLRESNDRSSNRFEQTLSSEGELIRTQLLGEMQTEIWKLRHEIEEVRLELLKWTFGSFYFATLLGLVGLMVAMVATR